MMKMALPMFAYFATILPFAVFEWNSSSNAYSPAFSGLMVTDVSPYYPDGYYPASVHTIECDLTPIESREVTAHATEIVTH